MLVRTSAAALVFAAPALAQWSTNPAANLTVADRSGDQVQPRLCSASDGGCYLSWFDNSAGGYDVYLQRLDVEGVEQWPHNGLLIADRSVSSTVDYDLLVAPSGGNAVLAYNDDTIVPGTQQIQVQKISPDGTRLWGPRGVTVSDGVSSVSAPPRLCQSGFETVVGWTLNNVLMFQKVSTGGVPQWSTPVSVSEPGHYLGLCDLVPDDAGGFVALWVRGSTTSPTTSSKALYAQRFDSAGAPVWNSGNPVVVFNTTSIQNGYFPGFLTDGFGGAVFAWYEIGGSRNAYIQHVLPDGTLAFPAPIASTGATPGRIRLGASVEYDAAAREYFLASEEGTTSTVADSVIIQKFDQNGNRLWGDSGVYAMPISAGSQPSFVQCQLAHDGPGGCMVFCITPAGSSSGLIAAARVNRNGTLAWSTLASSTPSARSRLTSTIGGPGFAILAWGNGATGPDIQVQNVNLDGTLGYTIPCYSNCDGSTGAPVLNVNDFICFQSRFAGQDPYADCNHDSALNVNDFICFQASFAAGCK